MVVPNFVVVPNFTVPGSVDPSGLSTEPWQSHHWFVQDLVGAIGRKCSDINIDDFATKVHGTMKMGDDHDFIHYMGGYDFNNLSAGRGKTREDHPLNYNMAVDHAVKSSSDCCDLVSKIINLIDSYWTLLQYYRMETIGPEGYQDLQIYGHRKKLDDGDSFTKLLRYQEVKCGGRGPRPLIPNPGWDLNFLKGKERCISIPKANGHIPVVISYSPYYRHQEWRREENHKRYGSVGATTTDAIERSMRYEADGLRSKFSMGLLDHLTPEEIESRYSESAIEEAFNFRSDRRDRSRQFRNHIQRARGVSQRASARRVALP